MSDAQNFGFGKFVPGFDFLQSLTKGAGQAMPQMPGLSNWVAPTLNTEELEKRIDELRAVHFWLEQNSKALGATIQALQVQKMTLATLKGMNLSMAELAQSMQLKPGANPFAAASASASDGPTTGGGSASDPNDALKQKTQADAAPTGGSESSPRGADSDGGGSQPGVIDPLQWWGSLTQQFQEIAATAMRDGGQNKALDAARDLAAGMADQTMKAAGQMAEAAASGMASVAPAAKTSSPSKRAAGKTPGGKKAGARSKAKSAAKAPRGA